ncbi:potassium-transporting ATPase subunit KdpA [bacterium]|nr:potassium-transporting ATPase subunit KdpA [bacterium]
MAEFVIYLLVLVGLAYPLGQWMFRMLERERHFGLENLIYKLTGVQPDRQMGWREYLQALLVFNLLGLLVVYALQRVQGMLPGNPLKLAGVDPYLAFNTASSFASNTNWQAYGGETTMSWATQMLALTTQNFVSAATGIAAMIALCRGLLRTESRQLGNFWVDLTRATLTVLLPLSVLLSLILVSQGVPQTFHQPAAVQTIESQSQLLPLGPVASQVAIKQLGTNGGGFYNVNSAHPLENPTPLSNFLECLAILLLPAALCHTYGRAVHDRRQGWALLAAMLLLFVPLTLLCMHYEAGNWEGKEVRFGEAASALWACATTAASNGSVNCMHDSLTALGGFVTMVLMLFGEVVFGGVGCGVYGIVLCVLVAVFVAGLMVGRTPEYLGKKIETFEIKMVSLGILCMPTLVLLMTAGAMLVPSARAAMLNTGPHGFSEILYACTSMGNNNGSAFGGLSANQPYYNLVGGLVMLISRFWILIPVLAIAGSLGAKKRVPESAGTLPTHSPLFVVWLCVVIVVVGALCFFPALCLGPMAEHLRYL